ncbi:hypothetical protein BK126_02880 [Paenibacillus sp. FSL H7-0326]|nr:hypothetical protein BK126_02880 [Paenibacillus sp. FSL H7-0326]
MNISRGRCLLPDLIASRGWTQADYADKSGRHPRVISHFCNNKRVMLPEDMYIASKIFKCRMEDLYEWEE